MSDFIHGRNDPSPVRRVIAFGYYDGATDGVLELDGAEYRFDLADERHNPDGCDERTFTLRPLPTGSFERLVATIGEHLEPGWPTWVPVWIFPSEQVRLEVERRVDAILDQASKPPLAAHHVRHTLLPIGDGRTDPPAGQGGVTTFAPTRQPKPACS